MSESQIEAEVVAAGRRIGRNVDAASDVYGAAEVDLWVQASILVDPPHVVPAEVKTRASNPAESVSLDEVRRQRVAHRELPHLEERGGLEIWRPADGELGEALRA